MSLSNTACVGICGIYKCVSTLVWLSSTWARTGQRTAAEYKTNKRPASSSFLSFCSPREEATYIAGGESSLIIFNHFSFCTRVFLKKWIQSNIWRKCKTSRCLREYKDTRCLLKIMLLRDILLPRYDWCEWSWTLQEEETATSRIKLLLVNHLTTFPTWMCNVSQRYFNLGLWYEITTLEIRINHQKIDI